MDDGSKNLNLILDHNTTAAKAWTNSTTQINANGPIDAINQLKTDTLGWKGTITPSNYTMDQRGQTSNAYYIIDYSEYKARLITAQEVAQITGADKEETLNWEEKSAVDLYYFDSLSTSQSDTCKKGNTIGCKYGWLYDRTSLDCNLLGCLNNSDRGTYGYWTSAANASQSTKAWLVNRNGYMYSTSITTSTDYGIRPVIEVLKSNL